MMDSIKYLGINIENKRSMYMKQSYMYRKSFQMAHQVYSIILRSCNKLLIGKTFWKSLVLPTVLYGSCLINYTEKEMEQLQTVENGVYRQIQGALLPICA